MSGLGNRRYPPAAPLLGARYRLVERLGEGAMAGVYRAWDEVDGAYRAIKVLLPEFCLEPGLRQRFENEARMMREISHRNVVEVYEVAGSAGFPYLVMALCQGGTLYDWCRAYGKMPPRTAVDVAIQVCRGVSAAHALGVIHRDVKPQNVLLTEQGHCKVTDFGIARIRDTQSLTRTGTVMGTLGYMAPEQRLDAKSVDERADVYGITATLFRVVGGGRVEELFRAKHDRELLAKVPPAMAPLFIKGAAYHREDRYPDVDALAGDLVALRRQLPAPPPDTPGLGALAREPPFEPDTLPDFPEIAGALQRREVAETAPRQPLPYTMPKAAARSRRPQADDDALPTYVDPASVPAPPRRMDIALDPVRERTAPVPPPRTSRPWDVLRRVRLQLLAFAAVLVGLALFAAGSVAAGAHQVRGAAARADAARAALYDTIHAQGPLVRQLGRLGPGASTLEQRFAAFGSSHAEPERSDAALRFVAAFEAVAVDLLRRRAADPSGPDRLRQLEAGLTQLEATVAACDRATTAWEEAARSPLGGTAVRLGLARPP